MQRNEASMYANTQLNPYMAQVLKAIAQATPDKPYTPCGSCGTAGALGGLRARGLIVLRGKTEQITATSRPGPGWDLTPEGWKVYYQLRKAA